jgi:hypothetical protein
LAALRQRLSSFELIHELRALAVAGDQSQLCQRLGELESGSQLLPVRLELSWQQLREVVTPGSDMDDGPIQCLLRHFPFPATTFVLPAAIYPDWGMRDPGYIISAMDEAFSSSRTITQIAGFISVGANHFLCFWMNIFAGSISYYDSLGANRDSLVAQVTNPVVAWTHLRVNGVPHWDDWKVRQVLGPRQGKNECAVYSWHALAHLVRHRDLSGMPKPSRLSTFIQLMDIAARL